MTKEKRFRGIHYHIEPNGTIHIWIYSRSEELQAALRIVGNKVYVERGIVQ